MPRRTEPPFRADHVGSLLRPPALLAARERFAAGTLDADGLRAAEDAAIRDVVAMQEEIGLQSATDGEFRRTSWHMDFIYQLGGGELPVGEILTRLQQLRRAQEAADVVGPERRSRTIGHARHRTRLRCKFA